MIKFLRVRDAFSIKKFSSHFPRGKSLLNFLILKLKINPDINAQDFGRKMKKTIPIEKFYTAVFFLLKQNIIFFKLMA